jgi:NADP-dependent aldehyde dehydrogenase
MRTIGTEMEAIGDELIRTVMEETHLPEARVKNERARTIFQLTSYAAACEAGHWLEARIDTANAEKGDPDLRKMQVPLGPVVVFGASNFPFAYSTAGGDTASALAAGCPVVVKAHPAHPRTSELVAKAIFKAVEKCGMPKGVFAHVHGASFETGKALVTHPHTRAVGFTGSYAGGKALFDWANQRKAPSPVFAEMGSVNPVFVMPDKLKQSAKEVAGLYAGSITLGTGQFCTNPGLIAGIDNEDLQVFIRELGAAIQKTAPGTMLHPGIAKAYGEKRKAALEQKDVKTIAISDAPAKEEQGVPTVASATAQAFFNNPLLHQEVFGPYSLVIRCADKEELLAVATRLEGQLTCTMMATEKDIREHADLVDMVQDICGRFIHNGVPTGVRVALSMQHGGPFPATTDSRFTSVGADGIKRWIRPLSFQNWEDNLLPDALKNSNPLGIFRMVNDQLTNGGLA